MLYESLVGQKPDPANYVLIGDSRPELEWIDPIIQEAVAGESTRIESASQFAQRLRDRM